MNEQFGFDFADAPTFIPLDFEMPSGTGDLQEVDRKLIRDQLQVAAANVVTVPASVRALFALGLRSANETLASITADGRSGAHRWHELRATDIEVGPEEPERVLRAATTRRRAAASSASIRRPKAACSPADRQ